MCSFPLFLCPHPEGSSALVAIVPKFLSQVKTSVLVTRPHGHPTVYLLDISRCPSVITDSAWPQRTSGPSPKLFIFLYFLPEWMTSPPTSSSKSGPGIHSWLLPFLSPLFLSPSPAKSTPRHFTHSVPLYPPPISPFSWSLLISPWIMTTASEFNQPLAES